MFTIIILLILSAIFSASETAFTSLSRVQKIDLAQSKKKNERLAAKLSEKPKKLITAILIGNNIVNLVASSLTTVYAIRMFGNNYVGYATGILTILILIFGEIAPKQLAMTYDKTFASFMAYPIWILCKVLFPAVWVFMKISKALTGMFSKKKESKLTVNSLMNVMDIAQDEGLIDEYETNLVQRAIHFNESTVKGIMTHRTKVFSLKENITLKEAFPLIIEKGYSRIPLYRNSPENIQGIVLVRDLSKAILEKRENEELLKFALDPIFVPETLSVNELFFQFKQKKLQIAIVLDEYGGLSGVATMEDVAEQLLGELYDEHESGLSERITCLNLKTNTYLILCDTSFQQFLDEFGIKDEIEENINTVASYILENAGHIPKLDEKVETEYGTFLITKRKGNRLESCKFYPASVD